MLNDKKIAYRVSVISITGNIILSLFKLLAGIIGSSSAMISDSIHSMSDVFSTVVVIIGIKMSSKEADSKHQYGHERYECVSSIILALSLCIIGVYIGYQGIYNIVSERYLNFEIPGAITIVAAVVSILIKEFMYHYTIRVAKKFNSDSLRADAWHHRSDSLSSVASLMGIVGTMCGVLMLDCVASVVISVFIVKIAIDIFRDSIDKMLDCSVSLDVQNDIKVLISKQKGVLSIDELRTRMFGSKIYVDVEIAVDKNKSLMEAHEIAHNVHDVVEKEYSFCKHCMVHVNPYLK